ncbi:hypothetical protein [Aeromonas intestinalis]
MKTLFLSIIGLIAATLLFDQLGTMLAMIVVFALAVRGAARWIERMIRVSRGEG